MKYITGQPLSSKWSLSRFQYLTVMLIVIIMLGLLVGCARPLRQQGSQQKAAQINLQLALHYMQKHDMARAKRKLRLAHKQNPNDVNIVMMLAYWYQQQGQAQQAQMWYQRALKQHPHDLDLINNYSDFLCEQQHFQRSIKGFKFVAKHRHNNQAIGQAYQNAALCSLRASKKDQAHHYFKKALKANPHLILSQRELTQ